MAASHRTGRGAAPGHHPRLFSLERLTFGSLGSALSFPWSLWAALASDLERARIVRPASGCDSRDIAAVEALHHPDTAASRGIGQRRLAGSRRPFAHINVDAERIFRVWWVLRAALGEEMDFSSHGEAPIVRSSLMPSNAQASSISRCTHSANEIGGPFGLAMKSA